MPDVGTRVEFDLLRAAGMAASGAGAEGGAAFRATAPTVCDWLVVLEHARAHRMLAAVGVQVDALAPGTMPVDAARAWGAARLASAGAGLAAAAELARVAALLRAAGVEPVAYKGPALSLVAYGESGARPSTDLDLVVPPDEYPRARSALLAAGFRSRRGLSRVQEAWVMHGQGHADFARDADAVPFVELHWRFAAERLPWTLPVRDVRARGVRVRVGGADVIAPCAADQVVLLSWHGTRHHWAQFEWLASLAAILRRSAVDGDAVDGDAVLARARTAGGVRAVLVGVELARRVLDAPVPAALSRAMALDARIEPLVRQVIAQWSDAAAWSVPAESAFERACLERPRDVLRRAAASAMLPTLREWESMRLPGVWAPLYVPLRLGRLAWRAVTGGRGDA